MNAFQTVRAVAVATLCGSFAILASAQTLLSAEQVSVSVTLASKCRWSGSAPTGLAVDFGQYTAFQTTAQTPATPQTFTVECTRGFGASPTIAWDGATNLGVINGLQYQLTVTPGTPQPGAIATTSTIGSGDQITYTLSGSMPLGQAGTDGTSTPVTRNLTMSF